MCLDERSGDVAHGGAITLMPGGQLGADHDEERVGEEEDENDEHEPGDGAEVIGMQDVVRVERKDQQVQLSEAGADERARPGRADRDAARRDPAIRYEEQQKV